MDVWFTRSNGDTLHNNPATDLFIPGEPPRFPNVSFDHTGYCLREGFARIGWPAAGDLRLPGWRERAVTAYGSSADSKALQYLEGFLSIQPGDVVLTPAARTIGRCHIGLASKGPLSGDGSYHYHYDLKRGEWYENAHRVYVKWAKAGAKPAVVDLHDLGGGVWRRAFASVKAGADEAVRIAVDTGLLRGAV